MRTSHWPGYPRDDEVFHEEVKGHFWHIRYAVVDPQAGEPSHVTVATTRPETLLGDTAVAVHPDPAAAFAAVEAGLREKLAAAPAKEKPQIEVELDAIAARRTEMLAGLERLAGMARAGRTVRLPLLGREIPLVADEWAKPEMGSGCVKITPAHATRWACGSGCQCSTSSIPMARSTPRLGPIRGSRSARLARRWWRILRRPGSLRPWKTG